MLDAASVINYFTEKYGIAPGRYHPYPNENAFALDNFEFALDVNSKAEGKIYFSLAVKLPTDGAELRRYLDPVREKGLWSRLQVPRKMGENRESSPALEILFDMGKQGLMYRGSLEETSDDPAINARRLGEAIRWQIISPLIWLYQQDYRNC